MNKFIYLILVILISISSCYESITDKPSHEVTGFVERWTDYHVKIYRINLGDSTKLIIYDKLNKQLQIIDFNGKSETFNDN